MCVRTTIDRNPAPTNCRPRQTVLLLKNESRDQDARMQTGTNTTSALSNVAVTIASVSGSCGTCRLLDERHRNIHEGIRPTSFALNACCLARSA